MEKEEELYSQKFHQEKMDENMIQIIIQLVFYQKSSYMYKIMEAKKVKNYSFFPHSFINDKLS